MRWPWSRGRTPTPAVVWLVWMPDEAMTLGVADTEAAGMRMAQDDMTAEHPLTWTYSARTGRWAGRAVIDRSRVDYPGVYEYELRRFEVLT